MRVTFVAEAERELIEGARFYADQSGNELGLAFIAEFERCVGLLRLQRQTRRAVARSQSPHAFAAVSVQRHLRAAG